MPKQIKKHGKVVLILGLTLVLLSMYFFIPQGRAATIDSREMKISDSRPTQPNVEYDFEGDHSGTGVKCLEVVFCTTATGTCSDWGGDASSAVQGTSGNWSGWTYADWTASTMTATRVLFTTATAVAGSSNYSFSASTVTNPSSPGTYYARAASYSNGGCSAAVDSGVTAFAIVYGVAVSATVPESLTFGIALVTNDNCDTSFGTADGPASTASTVPFGTISSFYAFNHACQDLTVTTNAGDGYTVTGQETTSLYDSVTATTIDDSIGDASAMSETATDTWTSTGVTGFAFACAGVTGSPCTAPMTSSSFYRQFACRSTTNAECNPGSGNETATAVMSSTGAVDADQSRIEYKLNIGITQTAGAYSNTIVYIATPTY